jgi:putative PIN family toxin of toxin-antitoxin system
MARPQRVILDSNIIVSRMIFPRGVAAVVFDLAYESCVLLTSEAIMTELRQVAGRAKFDRYLNLSQRHEFVERYSEIARWIVPDATVQDCRGAKDNRFLELALSGRADVIVSGDEDLLALNPWRGVSIVTPAVYLDSMR